MCLTGKAASLRIWQALSGIKSFSSAERDFVASFTSFSNISGQKNNELFAKC